MEGKNIFQIAVIGLFAFFLVFAVLVFSGAIPLGSDKKDDAGGSVVIWGTLKKSQMLDIVTSYEDANEDFNLTYTEKSPDTFNTELVEAVARGKGPDLVLFPQAFVYKNKDLITTIPFTSLSERNFRDTFIEQGELFLSAEGVRALPVAVDPLVLYYNRDLFANEGIALPPVYWDELLPIVSRLTVKDSASNIIQTAIPLGEYDNIPHAKEILSALFMQLGSSIVKSGAQPAVDFGRGSASALTFYTNHANPVSEVYSWNKALLDARDMFISGKSAMYIGFASELFVIQQRNPNLNFDVAPLPQGRGLSRKTTYGNMIGIAIMKSAPNPTGAFTVASAFVSDEYNEKIVATLSIPSARRSLLAKPAESPYLAVFNGAALISRGWLDPDPVATEEMFKNMVNGTLSGRVTVDQALSEASNELRLLLMK